MDQDGLPVRLLITPGQASDKTAFPDLIAGLPRPSVVVADRGYDSRALVELVAARGGEAHIPTQSKVKAQRSVDRQPRRNPLRENRQKLPRRRSPRVGKAMAPSY